MHKFIFEIVEFNENWKEIDRFSIWITSSDRSNAIKTIDSAFPFLDNYKTLLIKELYV